MNTTSEPPNSHLFLYLRMLAGDAQPDQFFDIRDGLPGGVMRQRFISVSRIGQAVRQIACLARRSDVYVGVALRDRTHGGKSAISGSHLLYIECDDPHSRDRLARFAHPPTMETASGTPGHLHLYWWLYQRAATLQVESANRRLALALGGDTGCFDITRILRAPETLNHKHDPPRPVTLLAHRADARYTIAQLTSGLPPDPQSRHDSVRTTRQRAQRTTIDRELLAISTAEYVRVLVGLIPNTAGKVLCPFHQENHPSLQIYPDGTFYCFGSTCKKGGTIFDFAAALWLIDTRSQDFLDLRDRLAQVFLPTLIGGSQCSKTR